MKHVHLVLTFLLLSAVAGSAVGAHASDSTQAVLRPGTLASGSVNTTTSSGTLDQENTTIAVAGWTFSNSMWIGQTFTAGKSGALSQVDLNLFCNNCPTAQNVIVSVRAASGGLPTGSDLAASTLTVGTAGLQAWYSASFASPTTVSAGTQYAILIRAAAPISSNFLYFSISSSSQSVANDVYPGGTLIVSGSGGTPWSIPAFGKGTADGGFKTYVGGSASSSADLSISITDGATTETPGTPVTYTITASNSAGSSSVSGATVTDTFPQSLSSCTWTCSGANGGTCSASGSGNINSSVNLPGGASVTFSATCSISSSVTGSLVNSASITAPAGVSDTNLANNSSTDTDTLAPQADLTISNSDGVTSATPGGQVTYTITAASNGPSNASGATVADTFPSTLTCSWTCAGTNGGTCPASGSGNINSSVNLPAGGHVTFSAACAISPSATGTLTNTATVATPNGVTDTNTTNNSASDADSLSASTNVAATMTDNVTLVRIGDVVTYVIEVTNNNGMSTASLTVSDNLPAQLTNGSWVCSGTNGGTCGSASGSGNILNDNKASLPGGGKLDYLYTATVVSADSGGLVSNAASVKVNSGGNQATVNISLNDADTVVIFANGLEDAGAATAAVTTTTAVGGGGASMTIDLGVDSGLLNDVGVAPVTVATGRSANGGQLFSVQVVRLGSDVAMRTLTTIDETVFSDVSPWQVMNLKSGVISLDWRTASAHGDDGLLVVGSAASPSSLSAHNERENLTRLDVTVANNVPWLVPIEP